MDEKNASISVVSVFGTDATDYFSGIFLALCCRGGWPGTERALGVPAILPAAQ